MSGLRSLKWLLILMLTPALLQACVDIAAVSDETRAPGRVEHRASDPGVTAVPPRGAEDGSRFSQLADDSLWNLIAQGDGKAIVGLKHPGQPRGVYKSAILISDSSVAAATRVLRETPGVEVLSQDTLLPILVVRLRDEATLARVRRLPFLDYIDPSRIPQLIFADGTGCSEVLWSGSTVYSPSGDVVPALYGTVVNAWTRSNGAGITIGLVDTGIFVSSHQMRAYFASGESASRSIEYLNTPSFSTPWAECSHGTRMAGIMTAPRDGQGPIGVAWGANLVSVRHNDDVLVHYGAAEAQNAIRMAAERSHIVVMAWGTSDTWNNVSDEIRYWANFPPMPRLFIGAAGTQKTCASITWGGSTPPTLFPALMQEVVAVTAIDTNGVLACDVHGGGDVDLAAFYGYPTAGRMADLLYMRGSSSATAVVAGAAALVWSHYGGGAAHTRQKLYESAAHYPNRTGGIGYGAIDVMKALGGMQDATINSCTSRTCTFRYTTDTCRTEYYVAAPVGGDGPYTYQWSTGSTTNSTTLTICPTPGEVTHYSLAVSVSDADRLGATLAYRTVDIEVHDPWAPCPTCPQ